MWSVPVPQRPFGQAFQVITMHLFGDVPSPPIIGAIQGIVSLLLHVLWFGADTLAVGNEPMQVL